jgi:hypothetical protein
MVGEGIQLVFLKLGYFSQAAQLLLAEVVNAPVEFFSGLPGVFSRFFPVAEKFLSD